MPKAVLFDLDGTLWDRNAAVRELLAAQHGRFSRQLQIVPRRLYVDRFIELDRWGTADKGLVYEHMVRDFRLDAELAATLCADFWDSYTALYKPFPEVLPTLTSLRRAGVKLGLITNGSVDTQEAKIRHMTLDALMDVVVISEREGVRKPQREIFDRALERLGVPPSDAWFVGDFPDADIAGAYGAGLTAVWRYSEGMPPPTVPAVTIRTLDELLPLILEHQQPFSSPT